MESTKGDTATSAMAAAAPDPPMDVKPTTGSGTKSVRNAKQEIAYLAEHFKGQCKVITGSGRFQHVVKLHPENLDIVFNFKLTDSYPDTAPIVEVRSDSLEEDEMFDLIHFLTQTAESNKNDSLESLVNIAMEWLKEGAIDVRGGTRKKVPINKHKRKGKRSKKGIEDVVTNEKKPPMKTATDVIKRIHWDSSIATDMVIVGYTDRLEGLKEKYFTAFSWEDIASVDYTVLAIPKHRIQYFKYNDEIVWDKRCRLDNVFGSTGSKTTIRAVIARQNKANGEADVAAVDDDVANEVENHDDADSDYYDSADYSDTDSDDGISVTVGATGGPQSYSESDDDDDNEEDTENGHHNKYWRDKLRPNYFIALRITDPVIRKTAQHVQDYISEHERVLGQCSIPTTCLHITLCTVGLETDGQVQNAVQCLREAQEELASIIPRDKMIKFKGVDNFFNRVVYAKADECPSEFDQLLEHLKLCLIEKGIEIRDYHDFVPHVTLMKISRPVSRATGKKYVSPWLYSCFNDTEFGTQAVDNMHLCEMGDKRQEDGFYVTAVSLDI